MFGNNDQLTNNSVYQEDRDNRVTILQILCVALFILLLICVLCKLFFCVPESDENTPNPEQFTSFPPSELASDIEEEQYVKDTEVTPTPVATLPNNTFKRNTSNWRDEVVDHSSIPQTQVPNTTGEEYIRSLYVPPAADPTPPPIVYEPYVPPEVYPELLVNEFDSCGTVVIPDPDNKLENAMFVATFGRNPTAICMGTAIANDCDASRAYYTQGIDSGYVYIARRNDGVCGVGLSDDGTTVQLCSIEDLMNVSMKDSKSFAEWQLLYAEKPGQTFVNAYLSGLTTSVVAFDSSTSHCQFFALE
jgi:hypothetical protein